MDNSSGKEPVSWGVCRVVVYCMEEALLDVQMALAMQGRRWQDIPGLKTGRDAFDERMMAKYTRKPERVPFDRLVRSHLAQELPEFTFRKTDLKEQLHFSKPLTPSTDLLLIVEKIHSHGLGKTFDLLVAVDYAGADVRLDICCRPASAAYGSLGRLHWAYSSADDLKIALGGLVQMIREIIPPLEQAFRQWLGDLPTAIPDNQPTRVGLSAREALQVAQGSARAWQADAFPISLQGWHAISQGRLTKGDGWRFDFASYSAFDTFLCVVVPATGRVKWGSYPNGWGSYGRVIFGPLVDWVDSPAAWAAAQQVAQSQLGAGDVVSGRIDKKSIPDTGNPQHEWRLDYRQPGKTYSADLVFSASDLALRELTPSR